MAYKFVQITGEITYKGRKIETAETPMQIVYIVDGDREHALWSVADAKRYIRGEQTKYFPVDVRSWFN